MLCGLRTAILTVGVLAPWLSLRSSLALSIPPLTLCFNYDVGECSDLVFGVSLEDYATA